CLFICAPSDRSALGAWCFRQQTTVVRCERTFQLRFRMQAIARGTVRRPGEFKSDIQQPRMTSGQRAAMRPSFRALRGITVLGDAAVRQGRPSSMGFFLRTPRKP
ncbi:MAG: hypothetical protein ACREPP_11730, partial [Rhodanobacteraceae bacterium]